MRDESISDKFIYRLAKGRFAAKSNDRVRAKQLLKGVYKVQNMDIDIFSSVSYDDIQSFSRSNKIDLVSLRWLDVLRRVSNVETSAEVIWNSAIDSWAQSDGRLRSDSIAWELAPLESRSILLALGFSSNPNIAILIDEHIKRLSYFDSLITEPSRKLRLLQVTIGLQIATGASLDVIQEKAVDKFREVFDDDGYAASADSAVLVADQVAWLEELDFLEVDRNFAGVGRIASTRFWVHSMLPDGRQLPRGDSYPSVIPVEGTSEIEYVMTGGLKGSPPYSLSYANENGLVSFRSGWGETERNVDEETHASVIVGTVRGRMAHRDVARVTFYTMGREWLTDPYGDEFSDEESHSVVAVEGARYRANGSARLSRRYQLDALEGCVVSVDVFAGTKWQRHVVYSRDGDYLIVEDRVTGDSSKPVYQQWIIAPDVDIEPMRRGYTLCSGNETVALFLFGSVSADRVVEELKDSQGYRHAWRIRVQIPSSGRRAVAVLTRQIRNSVLHIRYASYGANTFKVSVDNGRAHEAAVVGDVLSVSAPATISEPEAFELLSLKSSGGFTSDDESRKHRSNVLKAVERIKDRVWEKGGSVEARREAIPDLFEMGRTLKVRGLRDYGYAAALIDVAGSDLRDLVRDEPFVEVSRRSSLIQWPGQRVFQPGYDVPILTSRRSSEVPVDLDSEGVWSVDLGQLVLSSYIHGGSGDILTAYFHGATDRNRFSVPRYERIRSLSSMGLGPVMSFSDPCLDLDSQMILSWFLGTESLDLHREIARMVESYARSRGIGKVVLVGNSGGGFAALQVAANLVGSRAVAFNPQIVLRNYSARLVDMAMWSVFGRSGRPTDLMDSPRMNLVQRYSSFGFDQNVDIIQNSGDDHHYNLHYLPFRDAYLSSDNPDRFRSQVSFLGSGHRVPGPQEYLDHIRDSLRDASNDWELQGLRKL